MYAKQHAVALTTDAEEAATGYTPVVTGRILQIRYVKDDFANGVDFTVTLETSGTAVWSQENVDDSATVLPRQATHSTAGAAAEYADGYPVLEPVYVDGERVKIVVAAGGAAKSGTVYVLVG